MAKIGFCRQKSKFLLFSHEILCCKTFQMTYYLFIYDVPNRSRVILKYSSVENYIWRKMQSIFGKYASIATLTYNKAIRMQVIFFYQSFSLLHCKDQTLAFLSINNIDAIYSMLPFEKQSRSCLLRHYFTQFSLKLLVFYINN